VSLICQARSTIDENSKIRVSDREYGKDQQLFPFEHVDVFTPRELVRLKRRIEDLFTQGEPSLEQLWRKLSIVDALNGHDTPSSFTAAAAAAILFPVLYPRSSVAAAMADSVCEAQTCALDADSESAVLKGMRERLLDELAALMATRELLFKYEYVVNIHTVLLLFIVIAIFYHVNEAGLVSSQPFICEDRRLFRRKRLCRFICWEVKTHAPDH
jgi:hypothetical protein